jgi:hypothetical protein
MLAARKENAVLDQGKTIDVVAGGVLGKNDRKV